MFGALTVFAKTINIPFSFSFFFFFFFFFFFSQNFKAPVYLLGLCSPILLWVLSEPMITILATRLMHYDDYYVTFYIDFCI